MTIQTQLPSLITIENGQKAAPTFSLAEYQRRQGLLRQKMAELQIDGVLFTSYHNINYYGDFLYCSFGRFYGLVVTPAKVVSISANIDGGQPWRRTVGDYNVVYTDWQRDNYFKACAQELPNKGRIGIEMDNLPLERFAKLQAAMPQVEFVDISAACMRMRMVKSAEEIGLDNFDDQPAEVDAVAFAALYMLFYFQLLEKVVSLKPHTWELLKKRMEEITQEVLF